MIAVTFALPQESRDFVRALQHPKKTGDLVQGTLGSREVLVAHVGVGPETAARRIAALLLAHRPEWLLSSGFAGGLHPRLAVGDLIVAENFSAPELVEKCRALPGYCQPVLPMNPNERPAAPSNMAPGSPRLFFGALTTHSTVVDSIDHKTRLARETGALAVDMETGSIAKACSAAGIPMLALRVISDAATDPLPVPMDQWFDMQRQRPRPVALLAFLLSHPAAIAPFTRFISGLGPARRQLTRLLLDCAR